MKCRVCLGTNLDKFLDLGFTPPADDFLLPERLLAPEAYYPLQVAICRGCNLVQLTCVVPAELLFQKEYPYESSTTETGRRHYASLASDICSRFNLGADDLAIDIGSNVGVLLQGFKDKGVQVLGIEPARQVCDIANRNGIESINEFFNEQLARKVAGQKGQAAVITGTNVVAHIDDLHSVVRGVDALLRAKGVFVFEAPYLVHLLEKLEYDTIYHEHLSYLSVAPMSTLFDRFGMELIDLQEVSIHGGTMRYFAARKGDHPVAGRVEEYMAMERAKGIYTKEYLDRFSKAVSKHRDDFTWMLHSLKREGRRIAGLSAPAKGMTLLNYCRIGPETLDFLTEKSPLKLGRLAPGNHLPVVPDSELVRQMPDYAVLLAWNFAPEIMKNNEEYRSKGGKFIIPIPDPRIA